VIQLKLENTHLVVLNNDPVRTRYARSFLTYDQRATYIELRYKGNEFARLDETTLDGTGVAFGSLTAIMAFLSTATDGATGGGSSGGSGGGGGLVPADLATLNQNTTDVDLKIAEITPEINNIDLNAGLIKDSVADVNTTLVLIETNTVNTADNTNSLSAVANQIDARLNSDIRPSLEGIELNTSTAATYLSQIDGNVLGLTFDLTAVKSSVNTLRSAERRSFGYYPLLDTNTATAIFDSAFTTETPSSLYLVNTAAIAAHWLVFLEQGDLLTSAVTASFYNPGTAGFQLLVDEDTFACFNMNGFQIARSASPLGYLSLGANLANLSFIQLTTRYS
jgi:hypothetical protein